ncbi:MAG: hypothetical protein V7736_14240 [Colwellia polaris]
MHIKEIVHCYVSETIPVPNDLVKLKASFVNNCFTEKEINSNKWSYKRGAALAFEFNYSSEAIEMEVILEVIGNQLRISVGNWGFPFEPLLMKKRFKKNLDIIVKQLSQNGCLEEKIDESEKILDESKNKKKSALFVIALIAILFIVIET